jgi:hypothetical protein
MGLKINSKYIHAFHYYQIPGLYLPYPRQISALDPIPGSDSCESLMCLVGTKKITQYQEEVQCAQKLLLIQHVTLGQKMSELSDFGKVSMT